MPKLSKKGLSLVKQADGPRQLSIEASRVILDEVLDDINFKGSIELDKVINDQRLRLKGKIDTSKKLNKQDLNKLLENLRLVGNGVSEDNASKFLKGDNIGEDACKYFCKALGIPYFKAIEGCRQLKKIEIVATRFNHTKQFNQFGELLQTPEKRIKLLYDVTNDQAYLQLKWLLLRCFNQSCNLNNSETLYIKFERSLSQPLLEDEILHLQQELIKQLTYLVNIPPDERLHKKSEWSDIGKFLRKRILFKKNVILVFYLKYWNQQIIQSFWDKLIKFLPKARDGEHCLSLLVINNINQEFSNFPNFYQIQVDDIFTKKDIWDCLQKNQKFLNLSDDQFDKKTNDIWKQSKNGQPEALLKAIYQQFNYNWDVEREQWYSLKG
jgi:hypothetical protein